MPRLYGWSDFFTAEVWTKSGLVTYYVLFFMHLATRRVHIAGVTPYPDGPWMTQVARNVTMAEVGFLSSSRYLIHDRDAKFCESFRLTIEAVGIKPVKLPARSPNLNAFAERWEISERRVPVEAHILRREVASSRSEGVRHPPSPRKESSRQGQCIVVPDQRAQR